MHTIQRNLSAYRDEIKGIAILWVIFFHAQLGLTGVLNAVQQIGYGGVDMFLFLSGYGLYHSLKKDADPARYLARRAKRLLPSYVPFCLIWLIVMIPLHGGGMATSIRIAAGNLTMLGFFAGVPLMINWYVSALALTLLLAPLMHAHLKAHRGFGMLAGLFVLGLAFVGDDRYMAVSRLPVFALGMMFARPCEKERRGISALLAAGCVLGLAVLYVCFARFHELLNDYAMYWHPFVLIAPALCAGLGWLFAKAPAGLLAPLRALGSASFEIFLFNVWLEVLGKKHGLCEKPVDWVIGSIAALALGLAWHFAVSAVMRKSCKNG